MLRWFVVEKRGEEISENHLDVLLFLFCFPSGSVVVFIAVVIPFIASLILHFITFVYPT